MPGRTRFETIARTGYAALVLLLALGTAFSVHRLGSVADGQINRIRAEELEITLLERLRWNAALIISRGRGYLISGDPGILGQLADSKESFDETLRLVRKQALDAKGLELVGETERAAQAFMRDQDDLLSARRRSDDPRFLVERFESELLPLRAEFTKTLNHLVDYKEAALKERYRQAKEARHLLVLRLYGLLVLLVSAGFAVARYFTKILGRAYGQEAEALESARRALAARDELMGVAAHDLRNPLGAIALKAALLRKGAATEQTRERAESIAKIATHMESLIRTMLEVVTIEAGKFTVIIGTCAAEALMRETTEVFGPLASAKHVELAQRVEDPGLALRADQDRVLQVLSNLVGNALKFTPEGGRVTLSVERDGDMARFGVSDTGPGIAPENLQRIFDRFWKAETTGKRGTGLGLFIAKGIVEAHGGRIWAESEIARGARVFFTLPVTGAHDDAPAR